MAIPSLTNEGSYIDFLEDVIVDISEWAASYVEMVVNALAPDGRVFGMKKLTEREELALYREQLRGNPEAWSAWVEERVQSIKKLLSESGLGEDVFRATHPYDVVERFALKYSYRMERLIREYDEGAIKQSLRPAVDSDLEELEEEELELEDEDVEINDTAIPGPAPIA